MRRLGFTCIFLSSLALASCSSIDPASPDDPVGTAASAIAYGTADTTHTAVVSLLGSISGGFTECSGTIVQITGGVGYVLTAAHCCTGGSPDVVVMSDSYATAATALEQGAAPTAPAYAVTPGSAYFDALYDPTSASPDHDFCMLKFPAPAGASVIPVASPQDSLVLDDAVEHVGFGQTDTSATNAVRRTGTAPVDQALTATILKSSEGGPTSVPGTCEGDSGGPALLPAGVAPSQQKVVGTTSYGDSKTCDTVTYGVCSRVSSETGPGGFITNFLANTPSGTAAPASCDTCSSAAQTGTCATQVNACLDDPSCKTLNTCLGTCTTQACATSCETTAGATATTELNTATTCISGACPQCSGGGGGGQCGGLTTGVAACDTCLDASCCSQAAACVADATCSACLTASPAASCAANTLLGALDTCVGTSCATPCTPSTSSSSSSSTSTGAGTSTSTGTSTGTGTSTSTSTSTGGGNGSGTGGSGNGAGGGSVSEHSGCSVAGTQDPAPLAPLAGLLLGAALTFSRKRRA